MDADDLKNLATEKANPRSMNLDLMPTVDMLQRMNEEDQTVPLAVAKVIPAIAAAVDRAAEALLNGGHLHYFGAGTSGRLGVLDATEIPPTFGVDASLVRGHLAGGMNALIAAKENAEDDCDLGTRDVFTAEVAARDVVVAITASGRTPYCLGVLEQARALGAFTVAVVCNRNTPAHERAHIAIDPIVGEEIISGSTRLKSGTAQKLVLNMISNGVMVRLGRTYGNLMVGVTATNHKLKERAVRLVATITSRSEEEARNALSKSSWDVRCASVMLRKNIDAEQAFRRLAEAQGFLRKALQ